MKGTAVSIRHALRLRYVRGKYRRSLEPSKHHGFHTPREDRRWTGGGHRLSTSKATGYTGCQHRQYRLQHYSASSSQPLHSNVSEIDILFAFTLELSHACILVNRKYLRGHRETKSKTIQRVTDARIS